MSDNDTTIRCEFLQILEDLQLRSEFVLQGL